MTGPISYELPNNVYNQLLMALCYSVITGPLVSVSAVFHLTSICVGEAAHFHSPLLPHRGEAGCVPFYLTHAEALDPFVCVWDSCSKQAYGHLGYEGENTSFEMIKLNPKTKGRSL